MRVLVTSSPSQGLLHPLVPLAWALRTAGHEVLVTAPANMAGTVVTAGLPFLDCAGELDIGVVMNTDRAGRPIPRPMEEQANLVHTGRGFAKLSALVLDRMLATGTGWRPDLVLSEHHEYAGGLVAARLGVPWVVHPIGMGAPPEVDTAAAAELAPELDRLGLHRMPQPDLLLDPCPPAVAPASRTGTRHEVRQVPYNGQHAPPDRHPPDGRRRALVTLGTRVPRKLGLEPMRMLIGALHRRDVQVLVAVADDLLAGLGPLPGDVQAGWIPVDVTVPTCDLVVHQCGSGTVMASLIAGVPQLLIPYICEQRDMARRLRDFGAAELIPPFEETPELVERGCDRLVGDDSYRQRAALLAAGIAAMPPPAAVVPALQALTN